MTYSFIEDVPERDVERALNFMGAAARLTSGKTATRVAQEIADECLLAGESRISHKELGRRTGVCRRTMSRAIHALLSAGLISRIDTTDGKAVYRACWERGDEHAAWGQEFDRLWRTAQRARRLKAFVAPAYPLPASGAANGQA